MFHTTKKFILEVSIPIANPVLILTKQMKIAFLNICLTIALSAILMDVESSTQTLFDLLMKLSNKAKRTASFCSKAMNRSHSEIMHDPARVLSCEDVEFSPFLKFFR